MDCTFLNIGELLVDGEVEVAYAKLKGLQSGASITGLTITSATPPEAEDVAPRLPPTLLAAEETRDDREGEPYHDDTSYSRSSLGSASFGDTSRDMTDDETEDLMTRFNNAFLPTVDDTSLMMTGRTMTENSAFLTADESAFLSRADESAFLSRGDDTDDSSQSSYSRSYLSRLIFGDKTRIASASEYRTPSMSLSDDGRLRDDEGNIIERFDVDTKMEREDDIQLRDGEQGQVEQVVDKEKIVERVNERDRIEILDLGYAGCASQQVRAVSVSTSDTLLRSNSTMISQCGQEVELASTCGAFEEPPKKIFQPDFDGELVELVPKSKKSHKLTIELAGRRKKTSSKSVKQSITAIREDSISTASGDTTTASSLGTRTRASDHSGITAMAENIKRPSALSASRKEAKSGKPSLSSPKVRSPMARKFFRKKPSPQTKPEGLEIHTPPAQSKKSRTFSPRARLGNSSPIGYIASRRMRSLRSPRPETATAAAPGATYSAPNTPSAPSSTQKASSLERESAPSAELKLPIVQLDNAPEDTDDCESLASPCPSPPELVAAEATVTESVVAESVVAESVTAESSAATELLICDAEKRLLEPNCGANDSGPVATNSGPVAPTDEEEDGHGPGPESDDEIVETSTTLDDAAPNVANTTLSCAPIACADPTSCASKMVRDPNDKRNILEVAADATYEAVRFCFEDTVANSFDDIATNDMIDDEDTVRESSVAPSIKNKGRERDVASYPMTGSCGAGHGIILVGSKDNSKEHSVMSTGPSDKREGLRVNNIPEEPVEKTVKSPRTKRFAFRLPSSPINLPSPATFMRKRKQQDSTNDNNDVIIDEDEIVAGILNELKLEQEKRDKDASLGVSDGSVDDIIASRSASASGDDHSLPQGFSDLIANAIAEEVVFECLEEGESEVMYSL